MSHGIVAYELIPTRTGTFDQIVNIFDFEDKNIIHDIREQNDFYRRWFSSFE
jgi:hypothetical protein